MTGHCASTLSPLMHTLCQKEQIVMMDQYVWVIEPEQFRKEFGCDSKEYEHHVPNLGKSSFKFALRRSHGSASVRTAFGILITKTSFPIYGQMSVEIEEVQWALNGLQLIDRENRSMEMRAAFEDRLLETVDKLTIKVAFQFTTK